MPEALGVDLVRGYRGNFLVHQGRDADELVARSGSAAKG